jgi:hypothetical protein
MSCRIGVLFLLLTSALPACADEPSREDLERLKRLQEIERGVARRLEKRADAQSPAQLAQEVTALQTLYQLQVTPAQLKVLAPIARDTAAKPRPPKDLKVSDDLRKTLTQLRAALLKADDEQIGKLGEKLQELQDAEGVDFDEDMDLTDPARRKAPAVLKLLSAKQVAAYLAGCADDIQDPHELLVETLGKVRGLPEEEWKALRDDVSDRVAMLVVGLDENKIDDVSERVAALLIEARNLKDDEFKTRKPDLEKAARKILGDLGPTDFLRNTLERTLAELLSNPSLPAAIDARLKK